VNNLSAGTYVITTKFLASNNQTVTSPPVTVYVDNPPVSTGQVSAACCAGSCNAS